MKHYSKEFKEEALKLSDEIGVKKAAQQLGVAYYTLADWRSIRRNTPPAKTPSADEQTIRIRELERENAELRTANNILKDALGFSRKTARSKSV
ncbi:MAG: transposase [Oscillospiraceae bacterium]